MYCPNCGLANEMGAKFCANCGTTLAAGPSTPANQPPAQYQQPSYPQPQYPPPPAQFSQNSPLKNIAIGCLVAVVLFLFVGVSCTRACLFRRHYPSILRRI